MEMNSVAQDIWCILVPREVDSISCEAQEGGSRGPLDDAAAQRSARYYRAGEGVPTRRAEES